MKRQIDHIRVLGVATGGMTAELGIGFSGTNQGATVIAATDSMNEMAIDFLASGHDSLQNGKPLAAIGQTIPATILGCTELAIASAQGDESTVCLIMRFGAAEIAVRFDASDIRQALSLLDTAAQGGLIQPGNGETH